MATWWPRNKQSSVFGYNFRICHCFQKNGMIFAFSEAHIKIIFTGRNEVVTKVIFLHLSVIHSVHGGGLPQCMLGYHHTPPEQTPLEQTTPWSRPSQSRHPPPRADVPTHPPTPTPWEANSGIWSTSGRYASYWNAFLLKSCCSWCWNILGPRTEWA